MDSSVVAAASTPTAMLEKMGIPVSCPLAVCWCGYAAELADVLSGLSAQRPPSFAIHLASNATLSAVIGIASLPPDFWLMAEIRLTATGEVPLTALPPAEDGVGRPVSGGAVGLAVSGGGGDGGLVMLGMTGAVAAGTGLVGVPDTALGAEAGVGAMVVGLTSDATVPTA